MKRYWKYVKPYLYAFILGPILMITEGYGKRFPDLVNELKMNNEPLVIEIPDRHGTGRKPNFITSYINEAIGVKL